MERYQELKENSTDKIEKSAVLVADSGEHLDELPISRTVRVQKVLVIQPQTEEQKENIKFALDVKSLAGKFATAVPKPDKKGKLMLSPEKIKIVKRQVVSDIEREKELRSEYPQFEINTDNGTVSLNGQKVNLHPSEEEISHDVALFLRYMDGYKNFHGDVDGLQRRYYEFANWFFCSPFMSCFGLGTKLADTIVQRTHVAMGGGASYGAGCEEYMRLNIGVRRAVLADALERIYCLYTELVK